MMAQRFNNLKIRYKILLSCSLVFVFSITLGGLTIHSILKRSIEDGFNRELAGSTKTIRSLVKTSASISIRQHLKGIAEKNLEAVTLLHDLSNSGIVSEDAAKKQASERLIKQSVGKTGYLAIVSSAGILTMHPKPEVLGMDISGHKFVREMISKKEGYLEYEWQNPNENAPRPKAMHIAWFEPWDWIITVSAYREEFASIIGNRDFRDNIRAMRFGVSGFAFVLDTSGAPVVSPPKGGIKRIGGSKGIPIQEILKKRNGTLLWKTSSDKNSRSRTIKINYQLIPEYNWIVASAGYPDEYEAPLSSVRNLIFITILVSLLFFLPITFVISSSITSPLRDLAKRMETGDNELNPAQLHSTSRDEVGRLTGFFNEFVLKLNATRSSLEWEIAERKQMEKEVIDIGDRERRKIGHDLHDDLCPHLIGIEGLCKVLKQRLDQNSPTDAHLSLQITMLIREATRKTRHLSRGLCPVYLVDHGLETSLKELAASTATFFGIKTDFKTSNQVVIKSNNTATHLFLIAREAINNAVKHSGASRITLDLSLKNERVTLIVQDNGCGSNPNKNSYSQDTGMGLRIMKFRANMIDAMLKTEFMEQLGTRVTLELPLNEDSRGAETDAA